MSAWYEDAVVCSLDVERFRDADGNGIGDFDGLKAQLGYVAGLGANCVWLLPFYPTPNLDNGYDVEHFYGVDPRVGSPGDFVEFMEEAERLGVRVIVDLVMSHTSDQHPWFQHARRDPASRYRNYYLWSEEPEGGEDELRVTGQEDSPWTYDEQAGLYYFHRFYSFQPDLNTAHPDVQEELDKLVSFWCRLGAAGVRVDAATFLVEGRDPESLLNLVRHLCLAGYRCSPSGRHRRRRQAGGPSRRAAVSPATRTDEHLRALVARPPRQRRRSASSPPHRRRALRRRRAPLQR